MERTHEADRVKVVWVLAATAVVRLGLAATTPLFPDETYYWEWSRRLAAGYFDHPPLVAWLIRSGTAVLGDTPLGVRAGTVAAGILGTWCVAESARLLVNARAALLAAIVLAVMPLSATGLVLATPDAGLLAGVAATLYCVVRALLSPLSSLLSLRFWAFAGMGQGIAFLAKYTAILVPLGVAIALVARADLRHRLREPGPYVATLAASLVFLPTLLWNAQHDWISFSFQLQHGFTPAGGSILQRELELLGGQLGLVSPILFALMLWAIAKAAVAKAAVARPDPAGRAAAPPPSRLASLQQLSPLSSLLSLVSLVVLAFFAYSATRRRVEANWPAIAYVPALLVLLAHARSLQWDRRVKAAIGVAAAMSLLTIAHTYIPILPLSAVRDPVARASGWDRLAAAVSRELGGGATAASPASARAFVAANRYQEASELAFHLPDHPETFSLNLNSRPNHYDYWPSFAESAARGDRLVLVLDDVAGPPPQIDALAPHFDSVRQGAPVVLERGGDPVRRLRIWDLRGWRGTVLAEPVRSVP